MRAVVEVLVEAGGLTVPEIGRRLDLPRQPVQRHVNDLVGCHALATRPNPAHRRSVLVEVTPSGRAAFGRIRAAERAELAGLAEECSDARLRSATAVLAALDRDVRAKVAERRALGSVDLERGGVAR